MLIIDKEETAKAQSWEAVIPCMCLKEITNPVNEGLDGGKFKNSRGVCCCSLSQNVVGR